MGRKGPKRPIKGGYMRILFSMAAALMLALTAAPVRAQEFPTKPISLIVPYTAGGPYDILARFMSEALRKKDNVATIV